MGRGAQETVTVAATTKTLTNCRQDWGRMVAKKQSIVQVTCFFLFFRFIREFNLLVGKEMATHSWILAWRIPGTEQPGRLLSVGSHRVGYDRSDLAAAAAANLLEAEQMFYWLLNIRNKKESLVHSRWLPEILYGRNRSKIGKLRERAVAWCGKSPEVKVKLSHCNTCSFWGNKQLGYISGTRLELALKGGLMNLDFMWWVWESHWSFLAQNYNFI